MQCLADHEDRTLRRCSPGGCRYYKGFFKSGDDGYELDPKVENVVAWTKASDLCCPSVETVSFASYKRMKFSPCSERGRRLRCESLCVAFCIVRDDHRDDEHAS